MIQFGDVAGIIYFLLVPKFYYEFRLVNYEGPKDGTSLVVHELSLCALNAEGLGSIPGQWTRSHMLQLRPGSAK